MMSPSHQEAIYLLFGLIGLLLFIIIGVLVMSQLKRRRPEETLPPPVEARDVTPVPAPEEPIALEQDVDLKAALRKTEENFFGRLRSLFASQGENTALEDIEEVLYTSDLGPKTVQDLMETIGGKLSRKEIRDPSSVRDALKSRILEIFSAAGPLEVSTEKPLAQLKSASQGPTVFMIVGVNGAGKTTSIGKIASRFANEGRRVLVAAGDTFRAAAGAQLKVWTERAQVEIFHPENVSDPAAVAFDAVAKARAQNYDVVLIDTAGRLHTQANLMEELKKVKRVLQKQDAALPHEVIIVLDANSGQNALVQAREFHKALGLTGAILTKMDGTAKGGVAIGLVDELGIPVKMIGVGERVRDLRPFSAREYVDSILGV
ncbi:MAG: signal recognition particle-docking protein FtsY [Bdellovibrionaceae bacterium]|nr:signal recognition particle-docking protein FtsY [Pseudobdellovibrionaceae bacterium]